MILTYMSYKTWIWSKNTTPATWGTDWDTYGTADHIIIALDPSLHCIQEVSIVMSM